MWQLVQQIVLAMLLLLMVRVLHQVTVQIKPGHTIIKTQVIDLTIMQMAQVIKKILMQIMGYMQKGLQLVKILQYKVQEVPLMVLLLVILQKLQVVWLHQLVRFLMLKQQVLPLLVQLHVPQDLTL